MRYRELRNGVKLTEVGLGTSQLGNLYRETSEEDAAGAVETAWNLGIRYFDTAPHYGLGLSERRLGALLTKYPRQEFTLSTKVGRILVDNPAGAGEQDDEGFAVPATLRREWDLTRDGIRRSIEASLERLGLDQIDIAYLHDPDGREDEAVATALPALIELRDEGMLKAVGAGMNDAAPLARFVRETDIDVVMVAGRLTLLDQSAHDELLDAADKHRVGIVAAGVYNSGILATSRPDPSAMYNYAPADLQLIQRATDLAEAAAGYGCDLPAAAVQFPLLEQAVASVVVGNRNARQVRETVQRYSSTVPTGFWDEFSRSNNLQDRV